MTTRRVRVGSRGSELALWQAEWVRRELSARVPGLDVQIRIIKTTGDRILDSPLSKIGDKGLFTREIEHALLQGEIDLAVHSLKDLPTQLPAGLALGAVSEREDVRDVFVPHPRNPVRTLWDQPERAHIATGSLRRKCQLLNRRPDFTIIDIRGNLTTRFRKLEDSDWAGMMLARAGVVRLNMTDRIGEILDPEVVLPAVGQGALGIEIREEDEATRALVGQLNHTPTERAAMSERALLRRLEGGCQVPIGTFGRISSADHGGFTLNLDAMVGSLDGRTTVRGHQQGNPDHAEVIGVRLAETLLEQGADAILKEIRGSSASQEAGGVEV